MEVDRSQMTGGSLHISTEVVAKIARLAALEVSGVAAVAEGNVQGILKTGIQKPVSVVMQDGIAEVSVAVYGKYGSVIQQVCAKVQENVKSTIQNMTGITVSKVNVTVVGLQETAE